MRRSLRISAVAALASPLLMGCAAAEQSTDAPAAGEVVPAVTAVRPHPQLESFMASRDYPQVAEPVRLTIPTIGVGSTLERLGRADDGSLQVPQDPMSVGWFTEGPRPGQAGPAVLLGHVDGRGEPAVFFRLHELARDDEIVIESTDGARLRFRVTHVEQHAKSEFPTEDVYHPTGQPELRLITCGGDFDAAVGHYRDNVIVFASLQV